MNDKSKFQRNPKSKSGGARVGGAGADKSSKPDGGAKKRPFSKPFKSDASGERPKRDFKREDRPRDAQARTEKPDREGPRKPYVARENRERSVEGREQPKRDFKGGDRPFNRDAKAPAKPYGKREETRKPFVPREDRDASRGDARGGKRFDAPKRDFASGKPAHSGFKSRPREMESTEETGERIAKRLARAGLASRRDAEDLIAAGRVKVNNKTLTSPAFNVMPNDIIHLDGMEIPPIERTRLFLFHKPAGVVTTNRDPEGRKTVFDVLPAELPRLVTIGRLDINTEGLLLLTNDGGLSRVLELPATGWLRRYRVRVHGKIEESALAGLREGIAVDGVFYGAIEATLDREQGSNAWLTLGLREGKNREVRNILGALGLDVTRLIRISYGPFQLSDLREGQVLEVKGRMLREQLGERLVEESGANFDAEIATPFSNKPVRRTEPRVEEPVAAKPTRDGERGRIGEGGLIKRRKHRENSRNEALDKLSTRPERSSTERGGMGERGPKPQSGEFSGKTGRGPRKSDREQRPIEPPGQRKANVWMASGARPIGKGRAEAEKAEADAKRSKRQEYAKPQSDRSFSKTRSDGPRGGDRPHSKRPNKGPKAR